MGDALNKTRLGNTLIVIGVFIWVLYALARWQLGYTGPVTPFLIVHLLFVVPGAVLAGHGWTRRLKEMFSGGEPEAKSSAESDGEPG